MSTVDLKPLGFFAVSNWDDRERAKKVLEGLPKHEDQELNTKLARYLREAPMVIPWMEYTSDLVGDSFGVSGGSAIVSDGTYFWRLDAAEYVETYGFELPAEFVDHARSFEFRVPEPAVSVDEMEQFLSATYQNGLGRELCAAAERTLEIE